MLMNSEFRCRICKQNAHGNHFGVYTCRACAAFFRRTANSNLEKEKCKKGGRNRDVCLCKPCRLRKCIDAGMNTDNFQFNRESNLRSSNSPDLSITPSLNYFVGRPEFLLFCDGATDSKTIPKVHIDVQNLISEASRLLDQGYPSPINAENQLKKLNLGFKYLNFDSENVKSFEGIGKKEFLDIIEFNFLTATKWITHFDEFHKLDKEMQTSLLQSIWHVWRKLHKCVTSAMYRKTHAGVNPMQKVMRNMLIDSKKGEIDTSWMSDYPREHATKYMLHQNMYDYDVIEALIKLDPTDIELTYMFAQLCFEYAGKRFQGENQRITDHFQHILSNDLHDYYVIDQKRERYFYRLSELMKVNNLIHRSIWESRPHRELGRVFNVLKIEFSHPDMFEDSGFC